MRWIRETLPEIKVLTVSSHTDREYIRNMLENGASGYITKDEAPAVLTQAIRSISRGMNWFSPAVMKSREEHFVEDQTLTEREVRILQQLLLEHNSREIAEFMGMDEKRVDDYLDLLMRKFRVNSLDDLKHIAGRVLSARKH
jgi:DNA-binding NarL/FixJ family response regulator